MVGGATSILHGSQVEWDHACRHLGYVRVRGGAQVFREDVQGTTRLTFRNLASLIGGFSITSLRLRITLSISRKTSTESTKQALDTLTPVIPAPCASRTVLLLSDSPM